MTQNTAAQIFFVRRFCKNAKLLDKTDAQRIRLKHVAEWPCLRDR